MEKDNAKSNHLKKADDGRLKTQRINQLVKDMQFIHKETTIHLMFQDVVAFGRIDKPKYVGAKGIRPSVSCFYIREYRYVYGAVEPINGNSCFLIMPYCNTACMNVFLVHLSVPYSDNQIILMCDGAAWHKSKTLKIPENTRLAFIPP